LTTNENLPLPDARRFLFGVCFAALWTDRRRKCHRDLWPPGGQWSRGSRSSRFADVRLLAPVEPSKIVCIGRNYAAHAAEMGNEVPKEPLMFLKPPSSIIGPEEAIVLTKYSQRVEHEGELALVIGRRCSQLRDTDDALSFVMGTPASTTSPRATFRKAMCNSLAPRVLTRFAPSSAH